MSTLGSKKKPLKYMFTIHQAVVTMKAVSGEGHRVRARCMT